MNAVITNFNTNNETNGQNVSEKKINWFKISTKTSDKNIPNIYQIFRIYKTKKLYTKHKIYQNFQIWYIYIPAGITALQSGFPKKVTKCLRKPCSSSNKRFHNGETVQWCTGSGFWSPIRPDVWIYVDWIGYRSPLNRIRIFQMK